jgi:Xaa-Pro aminopeptidase
MKNSDLYYATHFLCGDSFVFFQFGRKKFMAVSDLEVDRAKKQAEVDEVLKMSKYTEKAKALSKQADFIDILHEIFKEYGIKELVVPESTSFQLVDKLRQKGYWVEAGSSPFFAERYIKTNEEKKFILESQRAVFASIGMAREVLKKSRIKGTELIYDGRKLTSEGLRRRIEVFLLERGFQADETIVACGAHSVDPHDVGDGPLRPNEAIIIDVFPKSGKTRFYGDATRTFCKGRASDGLKRLYDIVKKGQELALSMVKSGVKGRNIHDAVLSFFTKEGYPTCEREGRMVGFFHGTGHSLGLDVHEEPARINKSDYRLRSGNVFSVEPGLYYPRVGGVRIEDLVYVTRHGCEILGSFPKTLEIR